MTQTELEQLSRDVAAKRGCEPHSYIDDGLVVTQQLWLTDDSAFCFELMVSESIDVAINLGFVDCYRDDGSTCLQNSQENYADHNNDANQATRVAILKAYLAKGE